MTNYASMMILMLALLGFNEFSGITEQITSVDNKSGGATATDTLYRRLPMKRRSKLAGTGSTSP